MEYQKPIKVILVDDEPDILDFLGYHLVKAGYETHTASNGKDAIKKAIRLSPDLVVLDIMMPECDGIRVCHRLKHCRRSTNSLVMFLTAGSSRFAQNALELAHADDYLLKPVPPNQFMVRVRALLQRLNKIKSDEKLILHFDDIELNKITKEFTHLKKHIKLKDLEFDILWLLASDPEKIYSIHEIKKNLKNNEELDPSLIKKYLLRLQNKIGEQYIRTVLGLGYTFSI